MVSPRIPFFMEACCYGVVIEKSAKYSGQFSHRSKQKGHLSWLEGHIVSKEKDSLISEHFGFKCLTVNCQAPKSASSNQAVTTCWFFKHETVSTLLCTGRSQKMDWTVNGAMNQLLPSRSGKINQYGPYLLCLHLYVYDGKYIC